MRLIGVDGEQLGIVKIADALQLSEEHEVDLVEIAPNAEPLGDFEATDPETPEAAALTKTTPGEMQQTASPVGFQINPFLIVGGLAAVYFLTRKKGRK